MALPLLEDSEWRTAGFRLSPTSVRFREAGCDTGKQPVVITGLDPVICALSRADRVGGKGVDGRIKSTAVWFAVFDARNAQKCPTSTPVAGLDPATHIFLNNDVGGRVMPGRGEFGFKTLELACKHEPDSSGSSLAMTICGCSKRCNPPVHARPEDKLREAMP
ncbi:MAG TPA: hypothetical protein VFQ82_12530 [Stellaceae bacterium]|jgi:hypothetical protein|nr:hypothetical protein [Stellaceae bacterium]